MGKASRWLANFLLGKKEDKRRKSITFEEGNETTTTTPSATTTPFNRRWSFGKLGKKGRDQKSYSRSPGATPLVKQAVSGQKKNRHDNNNNNNKTGVLAMAMAAVVTKRKTRSRYTAAVEDAAATSIQAAFRSYLAKKALHALRGLVKLQALVRGYLVRKQTTATLRRMHALMAIQIRARFHRIQMAEEPQFPAKSQSSRYGRSPQEMGFISPHRETVDVNLYENHGMVKRQNGFMNHSQIGRIEQGMIRYYSGELPMTKKEHDYKEFSFTDHNSPRHSPSVSKPTRRRSSFSSHEYHQYVPNYMANTQSSRAKVRSQSEPKQRPVWSFKANGNKKTASAEEIMNDNIQQHSKDLSSYSEYRKSLVTYEPYATLF